MTSRNQKALRICSGHFNTGPSAFNTGPSATYCEPKLHSKGPQLEATLNTSPKRQLGIFGQRQSGRQLFKGDQTINRPKRWQIVALVCIIESYRHGLDRARAGLHTRAQIKLSLKEKRNPSLALRACIALVLVHLAIFFGGRVRFQPLSKHKPTLARVPEWRQC